MSRRSRFVPGCVTYGLLAPKVLPLARKYAVQEQDRREGKIGGTVKNPRLYGVFVYCVWYYMIVNIYSLL